MKKIRNVMFFTVLIMLLVRIASATEISQDSTGADGITEEAIVQDTLTVSDNANNMEHNKVYEDIKMSKSSDNQLNEDSNNTIEKTTKNTKKDTTITSWNDLQSAINALDNQSKDTTLTLSEGTYINTGTIRWQNSKIALTIDGKGQTIDGNQRQVFFTGYATSLVLKNMTIINAKADFGGALSNHGTLKIINSTLVNNTANNEGGAIYNAGPMTIIQSTLANNTATNEGGAIKNYGTLTITDSTLINNTAYNDGGAIENDGTLNIINSTLVDNTAYRDGGAIENDGPLNIIESTLANNTATNNGGAFSHHITDYYNIVASNITGNHALNGGAIYSLGAANLTGNIFTNNTADNRETIDLYGYWNGQFNSNTYKTTDISLNNILSIKDDKESFVYGEDVVLNFNIELEHPYYYDKDVIDQIDKAIYINGEKKCYNKM